MYIKVKMDDTEPIYAAAQELTNYIERSDDTGRISVLVVKALINEIAFELDALIESTGGDSNV